jgi:hypothetical protein
MSASSCPPNQERQGYANLAWARQKATDPVSNQFLFDNVMTADRRLRRRFLALD